MNYNELKFYGKSKNLSIEDIAEALDLTSNGFKRGFESGSFPISKVPQLCKLLGISPNELFGEESVLPSTGNYAANITGGNTQNSNEAIRALREELKEKRVMLREKDNQIDRLLSLLEKSSCLHSGKEGFSFLAADSTDDYSPRSKK